MTTPETTTRTHETAPLGLKFKDPAMRPRVHPERVRQSVPMHADQYLRLSTRRLSHQPNAPLCRTTSRPLTEVLPMMAI